MKVRAGAALLLAPVTFCGALTLRGSGEGDTLPVDKAPARTDEPTIASRELELVSREDLCGGALFTFRWDGDHRMVRAWMPPGHDATKERLPCLWLNDGQNVFRDEVAFGGVSWGAAGTVSHLVECGCIPRTAVIAIDHAGPGRPYDYLPVPPGDWDGMRRDMADAPGGGVGAYLDRVLSELLPWAERRFGLSREAQNKVFGGSSFGGVATLYMAMLHPTAFRGVLIESPSFWACQGRLLRDVAAQGRAQWPERIYLAMGGREYSGTRPDSGDVGARCDEFLARACGECAEQLARQGVSDERLDFHVEPNGAHNERDWCRRLPRALRWLLAAPGASEASFWTRPAPLTAGRPFELYVDPARIKLPTGGGSLQVHLGFDAWSRGVQRASLLPAGLPRAGKAEGQWLVAILAAPPGARDVRFAFTDGSSWDNNGGSDYMAPIVA